jgi:putative hydrolase of the HAD superfamily
MARFDLIAFDADDTLWHNERLYLHTQAELAALLAPYGIDRPTLLERLYQTETRNIEVFGYGVKSFTLSMIETAIALTGGNLSGQHVMDIIDLAKAQLNAPVELLEHVRTAVAGLAERHALMVITKGDLLDQESKLARSGLGEIFKDIEVVSEKTPQSFERLFRNHALAPEHVLMVGDSLRSDILPVLEMGGWAVYIPYPGGWKHEAAEAPAPGSARFYQLEQLGQLPGLLEQLEARD